MEADKVDKFLLANESKFPEYEIPIHRLLNFTPEQELILETTRFHLLRNTGNRPFSYRRYRKRNHQTPYWRRTGYLVACRLVYDNRSSEKKKHGETKSDNQYLKITTVA